MVSLSMKCNALLLQGMFIIIKSVTSNHMGESVHSDCGVLRLLPWPEYDLLVEVTEDIQERAYRNKK